MRAPITSDRLLQLCSGNADAVRLIEGAWLLSRLYDDCIDGDIKLSQAEVHNAMGFAMFGLRSNPVMNANPQLFQSLLDSVVAWRAANELQRKGGDDALTAAYTLRCSPYNFMASVVLAVSGIEAAVQCCAELHGQQGDDTLQQFMAEHAAK